MCHLIRGERVKGKANAGRRGKSGKVSSKNEYIHVSKITSSTTRSMDDSLKNGGGSQEAGAKPQRSGPNIYFLNKNSGKRENPKP